METLHIKGYRIIRELGSGGMATVYEAIQESLDRPVALKVMAPSLSANKDFAARFLSEGKTVAKLSHPHIVSIFDIGEVSHRHYMAMEYLDGGDLKNKIRDGLSPDICLNILRQIALALDYAFSKGVVHRDVKPENILFPRNSTEARLADFGISKSVDDAQHMTATGMSIGTPYYMSPEQCQGAQDLDLRSDLYGLGVVFYEMLCGRVPYSAANTVAIVMKHVQEPVPELPENLIEYQPLLNRLMAKDRNDRFDSANDLIHAMNNLGSGVLEPVGVKTDIGAKRQPRKKTHKKSVSQPVKAKPAAKRSGVFWALGGGFLAVIVALLIGYFQAGKTPVPGGGAPLPVVSKAEDTSVQQPERVRRPASDNLVNQLAGEPLPVPESKSPDPELNLMSGSVGFALQILTRPSDANIRILNIGPKYNDGMTLAPGRYHVEVSKAGYLTKREWVEIANADVSLELTLEKDIGKTEVASGAGCPFCPEMVLIKAGSFDMGDIKGTGKSDASPVHKVRLKKFWMSKAEITFDQWNACVEAGGCEHKPKDRGWGRGNRPVIFVNWQDANSYTKWLSRVTNKKYRLPSEAEWEYAARSGTKTAFSWGDQVGNGNANCDGCGSQWDNNNTAPVMSFKPNQFGLYDMHGNVWEWTQDCWNKNYAGAPTDGSAWLTGDCSQRVLRGGSWYFTERHSYSSNRYALKSYFRMNEYGFRVVHE